MKDVRAQAIEAIAEAFAGVIHNSGNPDYWAGEHAVEALERVGVMVSLGVWIVTGGHGFWVCVADSAEQALDLAMAPGVNWNAAAYGVPREDLTTRRVEVGPEPRFVDGYLA